MIIITIIYTTNVQIETLPNETKSRLFYFLKEDHLSISSRKYDIYVIHETFAKQSRVRNIPDDYHFVTERILNKYYI